MPTARRIASRRTGFQFAPLSAALLLALPALAQEAPKLESVTVTAERRAENIKDVPSSVSTISGEVLDVLNSSGQDVRALSGRVPSLNIESSFGRAFPRFYIRGYGNTDFRLNASQPVSLIYDDVVQENPILKGFPAFDLERIEVLAGPQGTLFGRNTPAGVVKFNSVRPSQQQEGYLSGGVGSDRAVNLEGAFNLPLTGAWSARVSALAQRRSDWVSNTQSTGTQDIEGYRDRAVRLQALYEPSKDFSALFNVHNRDLAGSARLFRANIIRPGSNGLVDGFDPDKVSIDGINDQTLSNTGGSMRLKLGLPGMALYSITGYETLSSFSRGDVDGGFGAAFLGNDAPAPIPFPSETADALRDHRQISQEFRLESATDAPLQWQTGLYFFNEKYRMLSVNYDSLAAGNPATGQTETTQENKAWAAFGSLTYAVSPQLKLRGGLRYTHDKKELSTAPDASLNTAAGLAMDTSDSKTNWDASATYAVTPDVNLYARVATGFRGASIQPASAFAPMSSAAPETNTSYEAGVKADLFDRRARLSASVFRYTVKDQQLTAVGGTDNANILVSAKKSQGQGVEMNLTAYLTDNLLMGLSGSYNHTKIKDGALQVFGCGGGCTVTDPAGTVAGSYNIDGNPLPNAPRWIGNVNLRYSVPTATGEWYVFTDWSYRSKVNFFLYESKEFTGKSLLEGGVRLGYIWGNGKYEAAVFGRNITDKVVATGAIDFNNLTGFINEPRTWGASFKATF